MSLDLNIKGLDKMDLFVLKYHLFIISWKLKGRKRATASDIKTNLEKGNLICNCPKIIHGNG